ncbi:MAG: hypothetical protein FWD39_06730 [Clostridiales bacterium]|nr:hypothetical protein [Clostridiales bacterium]
MSEQKIGFYEFKKNIGVVEFFCQSEFKTIKDKLDNFAIEDRTMPEENWQTLYMEQYFSADRSKKLCETYDEPADDVKEFNIVFFIYELSQGQVLLTPFGSAVVPKLQKLPKEYKRALEFEKAD